MFLSKLDLRIRDNNWAVFFDLDTSLGTNNSAGWPLAKCFNYTPKLSPDPQNKHRVPRPSCLRRRLQIERMQLRKVDDSLQAASGAAGLHGHSAKSVYDAFA